MRLNARYLRIACGLAGLLGINAASAEISNNTVKIGILSDFTGTTASWGGRGSVVATQMAVEEFQAAHPNLPYKIKFVQGDFQQKPDLAVAIAQKWMAEGVNVIIDMPQSATAIAINNLVKNTDVAALYNGSGHKDLVRSECNANMSHWTFDQFSVTKPTIDALTKGGKTWYFITVDTAGGKFQEDIARDLVGAGGGKIVGAIRNPTGTADFSSILLQAQGSKADVIGIIQGGAESVAIFKQAQEFGVARRQTLANMLALIPDIKGMGLAVAKNQILTEAFYWDTDDNTRAFARRFMERNGGNAPTSVQAGAYSAVTHYLKAVDALQSTSGPDVIAKMKQTPVADQAFSHSYLRADGRLVHDHVLVQVKAPGESKGVWDVYKVLRVVPGDEAFRPASKECSLIN